MSGETGSEMGGGRCDRTGEGGKKVEERVGCLYLDKKQKIEGGGGSGVGVKDEGGVVSEAMEI